jgi:integrase
MKFSFTMPFIKNLSIHLRPSGWDSKGQVVFESNPQMTPYILYDGAQDAPVGFGVKVGGGKKTFIVRRKIKGTSISAKVGDVADFMGEKSPLTKARADAAVLALQMRDTGKNPNSEARKRRADEITLGQAFAAYRKHATTREDPVSENTLKTYKVDVRKFEAYGWLGTKIVDFDLNDILNKFIEEKAMFPSAKERAFRHAITCINWCIEEEKLAAHAQRRSPLLTGNPFNVLLLNRMFRSPAQLEALRQAEGKRNPLLPSTTFGPFLECAWGRRHYNDNEMAAHYLIIQLLMGCRKSEHAACQWGELLTPEQRLTTSHIMLDSEEWGAYIFFCNTKNGLTHRLPLGPLAVELLRRRQESCANAVVDGIATKLGRLYVFPARNKTSKTGHYSDSSHVLDEIRKEAGILKLVNHDLRRSFGSMLVELDVPAGIHARFFNHSRPNVTALYTAMEWKKLRTWIERIEKAILSTAPNVYNSLIPTDWAMLDAPPPYVNKSIVRRGRPPKNREIQPLSQAA